MDGRGGPDHLTASDELSGVRVLMTADAVGGVWTYAVDLAQGLARHGAETVLAVLGPAPSQEQRAAAQAIRGLELVEIGRPLDWIGNDPAEIIDAGLSLAALAHERQASLVHLNSPAFAACGVFGPPVVSVCHSCVATWWKALRGTALPPDFAWRSDLVARGYAASDALIAPSAAFARATADGYGVPEPFVVHNGRPAIAYAPRSEADAGVFTAGRLWDEAKNLALLEKAAMRIDLPVRAAGPAEGPNGTRIDLRRVQTLGRLGRAAMARHLAARPIFCSPARYEPFGLAVLEAAQAGCALILSDIATFRELWADAAVFVSPDDDAALAHAIESLAADRVERPRLGAAARQRATSFSADAMVAGTMSVYCHVLGNERAAAISDMRGIGLGVSAAP